MKSRKICLAFDLFSRSSTHNCIVLSLAFYIVCCAVIQEHETKVAQHSTVRRSHAERLAKLQSRALALSDLLDWKCCLTCTADCLGYVKRVDVQRDFWLDGVMELRKTTCSFAEQQVAGHLRSVLKTLLQSSPYKLKSVVCGVEVCKSVFAWAHGFSTSTFNRVHAAFNKDYQKANPRLVSELRSTAQNSSIFSFCFVCVAGQSAC